MTERPACDRVILCHFNSYSVMLQLARFGSTILLPVPAGGMGLVAEQLGIAPAELVHLPELGADDARVRLYRVQTVDPPIEPLEKLGGKWRQLSELRGLAQSELGHARHVFDLIMGS